MQSDILRQLLFFWNRPIRLCINDAGFFRRNAKKDEKQALTYAVLCGIMKMKIFLHVLCDKTRRYVPVLPAGRYFFQIREHKADEIA